MRGRHQFTIGTHNELFKFRNLFIRDNFGVYEFASPELFAQGLAQSYSYSFSRTSDPRPAAEFWVYQLGFYTGDQWRVRDDLSLTYGLRLDAPIFPSALQRGQPQRGAALGLELLAGPPVQSVGLLPDSGRPGRNHPGRLLQRAAGEDPTATSTGATATATGRGATTCCMCRVMPER